MTQRFKPGDQAVAKDGRSFIVEAVDEGVVYCAAPGGAEMEFPQDALFTSAEWAARADGRRDALYLKLRQARTYAAAAHKVDAAAASELLTKADRLTAGVLDFVAYTVALRVLGADVGPSTEISIVKARNIFDAAKPDVRANLLAEVLFTEPAMLINAAKLGDNLLRALIDKGIQAHGAAFEEFCDRPRR